MRSMKEKTYVYLHPEALKKGMIDVFGLKEKDDDFIPTSIRDLQLDLLEQKRLLEIGCHPDDEIGAWCENGIMIVEEGECRWNKEKLDYELL